MIKTYYTPKEVAKLLDKNVETIYRWCLEGKIKAKKIGGGWVIPGHVIDEILGVQ